jgi:hypothetical protein
VCCNIRAVLSFRACVCCNNMNPTYDNATHSHYRPIEVSAFRGYNVTLLGGGGGTRFIIVMHYGGARRYKQIKRNKCPF